jgi:hypothetical protein
MKKQVLTCDRIVLLTDADTTNSEEVRSFDFKDATPIVKIHESSRYAYRDLPNRVHPKLENNETYEIVRMNQ